MSKVAKIVGTVASVVAFVAGVALLFVPGGQVLGVTLVTISGVASAVAAVSMTIAQMTAKPPDAKGSVNQVVIGRNMAVPYGMGRTYAGGMQVYDNSAGPDNRERTQVMVVSAAGPIEGFDLLSADFTGIGISGSSPGVIGPGMASGYYSSFLWSSCRKGLRPETAFAPISPCAPFTDWDSSYKMSGYAAYSVTMKFDKDAKRYSSGVPQWGVVAHMVKIYDPRLDSTYPGGSGPQRWNDEGTFAYGTGAHPAGENPALHALTYARGRYIEKNAAGVPLATPVKILGCGFHFDQIEVDQFVELANLCDANNWKIGGMIYEAPGINKWDNLKRILQAAGAEPVWSGGRLGVKINAPRVTVVTIGLPDLVDGEQSVQAMKSWRDKVNMVIPRVRLEAQRWEYTQLKEVTSSTYLAEDGEQKSTEVQFDLVQWADQGAQLAAYELVNGREFGPIVLAVKPYFMTYMPGEAVDINIPELGLEHQPAIILGRQIDPGTGAVMLSLESETPAKHAFALGQVGVAPPTPTIVPPDALDEATGALDVPVSAVTSLIASSLVSGLTYSISTAGAVTISNHTRNYNDKSVAVTGTGGTPHATSAAAGSLVMIYYDDPTRAGGAVTYQHLVLPGGVGDASSAVPSATHPYRHFVLQAVVPTTGTGGGGSDVGGGGGTSGPPCVTLDTRILLANGKTMTAGDIVAAVQRGERPQVRTREELSLKWGVYHVLAARIVEDQPVFAGKGMPRSTADHRTWPEGCTDWVLAKDRGKPDGRADVAQICIADARTFVTVLPGGAKLLNHNVKVQ